MNPGPIVDVRARGTKYRQMRLDLISAPCISIFLCILSILWFAYICLKKATSLCFLGDSLRESPNLCAFAPLRELFPSCSRF